jgi:hypothetical protein
MDQYTLLANYPSHPLGQRSRLSPLPYLAGEQGPELSSRVSDLRLEVGSMFRKDLLGSA